MHQGGRISVPPLGLLPHCALLSPRAGGRLTDMLSFYTLPSTVINNPHHSKRPSRA